MSNLTTTFRGRVTLDPATSSNIYNVTVTLANTETSQSLSPSTQAFTIRVRGTAELKLAYIAGGTTTTYLTIPPGSNYSVSGVDFTGSLYFQSSKPSQIVEIVEWS